MTTPNADNNASSPVKSSQPIKSTPAKPRTVSSTYEHNSVDGDFRAELEQFQYSGITLEEFLKHAFSVSDDELANLKKRVSKYAVHSTPEYKEHAEKFKEAAVKEERAMYTPYAKMGNMVIDRVLQDSQTPKNEIKLLPYDKELAGYFAKRKPDVLLVPKKDGVEDITKENLHWEHVLWVLEFKKKGQPSSAKDILKRPREPEQEVQPAGQNKKTRRSKPVVKRRSKPLPALTSGRLFAGDTSHNASQDSTDISTSVSGDPFAEGVSTTSGTQQHSEFSSREPSTVATPDDGRKAVLNRSGALAPNAISSSISSASSTNSNTNMRAPPEIQLANYLSEVMSVRGDRTHVFGALIVKTKMRLQYFSRSCGVISDEIDIIDDPILFAVLLVLITRQTHKRLGFNTKLGYSNPFDTKDKTTMRLGFPLERIEGGGDSFNFDPACNVVLNNRLHTEYCTVGRGTAVYEVERPQGCKIDLVLKASWQVSTRRDEDEAILIARDVDPKRAPEIYGKLIIPDASPTKALISTCKQCPLKGAEDRELRILLMRKYRPVYELTDQQFLIVMIQMIYFTHALYSQKSLLHRDIGIFNIACFFDESGELIGVLLDYDLATFPLRDHDGHPTSNHRSGTKPFMAVETLDTNDGEYAHHLVHELESILYTLVWHGVGYRGSAYPQVNINGKVVEVDALWKWRKGSWHDVCIAKKEFLGEEESAILAMISYPVLGGFCRRLCRIFDEKYLAIKAHRKWKRIVKSKEVYPQETMVADMVADLQALGTKVRKNPVQDVSPHEPPLPSNLIFPKVLEQLNLEEVTCTRDCCKAIYH